MGIATLTANEILNRVAAEVGIAPMVDPYASTDPNFVQLTYLLTTAGEELVTAYEWESLNAEHSITTAQGDSGVYPLPDDFAYMINQTGWERTGANPLSGPLSPQDWQYLLGRNLVSHTIYASFRIKDGKFALFPQPPPVGLNITFEYISKEWVADGSNPGTRKEAPTTGADVPLYDKTLITRYLKVKFLEAKGFDTSKAQDDLNQVFNFLIGRDKGAEILNAGRNNRGYPYLTTRVNVPDTGYGSA